MDEFFLEEELNFYLAIDTNDLLEIYHKKKERINFIIKNASLMLIKRAHLRYRIKELKKLITYEKSIMSFVK